MSIEIYNFKRESVCLNLPICPKNAFFYSNLDENGDSGSVAGKTNWTKNPTLMGWALDKEL